MCRLCPKPFETPWFIHAGWVVGMILVALVACSPVVIEGKHGEPKCNRAACWDDKSPSPVGADQWNDRHKDDKWKDYR